MSTDASWKQIDPGHPLVPVLIKMPPGIEGKLIKLSETDAIYMIKVPNTDVLLQLGVDQVQKPEDFTAVIASQGGTTELETHAGKLGGKDATETCGTVRVPLPHAVVQGSNGRPQDVDAQVKQDRYGGYFVPIDGRVFRATYRIPDKEAAQWEPVFRTILDNLTWK
ncbi:MAG: hypothetical protein WKG01_19000 [Kofleriaceae bacterium]